MTIADTQAVLAQLQAAPGPLSLPSDAGQGRNHHVMSDIHQAFAIVLNQWAKAVDYAPPRQVMPYIVRQPLPHSAVRGREVYPFAGPPGRYLIRGKPVLRNGGIDRDSPAGGVYAIRCSEGGRAYIGSTWFFNGRWSSHLSTLRLGIHKNRWLQKDWRRFGSYAFTFEVLVRLDCRAGRRELCGCEQGEIDLARESGTLYNVARAYDWAHDYPEDGE